MEVLGLKHSAEINEIAGALAEAQKTIKNPEKAHTNPHFNSNYADIADGLECIRPALSAQGIAIIQAPYIVEASIFLDTRLIHKSGQWIGCDYPVCQMGAHQAMGSAMTYAKRASAFALCGVAGQNDDDDGNAASAPEARQAEPKQRRQPPAPQPDPAVAKAYVEAGCINISKFTDVKSLKEWWTREAGERANLGIINGTEFYKTIYTVFHDAGTALARQGASEPLARRAPPPPSDDETLDISSGAEHRGDSAPQEATSEDIPPDAEVLIKKFRAAARKCKTFGELEAAWENLVAPSYDRLIETDQFEIADVFTSYEKVLKDSSDG